MKTVFDINACLVRKARPGDIPQLIKITRTIWDGHDYLAQVLDRWVHEPWFLVCQYRQRVIACLKLTLLPDNVLWFEGLRVHARFQGKGIGKLMNRAGMELAQSIGKRLPGLSYEFCTYYRNVESLSLTAKIGFEVVRRFITLDKSGVHTVVSPKVIKRLKPEWFHFYPDYIPLGWRSIHNSPAGLSFIRREAVFFKTPQAVYMLAGYPERYVTLLDLPPRDIKAELPYFQYFYGPRRKYGIIMPSEFACAVPHLKRHGFNFWDEDPDSEPQNMLILRMKDMPAPDGTTPVPLV
jgi:GNAT superfamily N-acetyltransferase